MEIVIPIALTALSYGLGPLLLLAFRRSRISQKKLKQFHIIYTVVVSLTFNFLTEMMGGKINFTPAILWGYIFYRINKSRFQNRGMLIPTLHDGSTAGGEIIPKPQEEPESLEAPEPQDKPEPEPKEEPEPKPVVLTYESDFKLPVKSEEIVETHGKRHRALYFALAILCCASLIGNVAQGYFFINAQSKIDKLNKDLQKSEYKLSKVRESRSILREEIKDLKDENSQYFIEHMTLNHSIGFIVMGSEYYHNYHCPEVEEADGFFAHNVGYCEWLGYPKHSACWD